MRGSLPPGDADVYTYTATAGQALTFNLARTGSNTTLQPGLIVYGPNGAIAGSSIGASSTQVPITSAVAGTYTVVVEESGGDNTGAYSVALNTPVGVDNFPPSLIEAAYRYDGHPPTIRLAFSEDVQASFQPDGFTLRNLTTNTTIDPADLAITFHAITNEIYFGFNPLPGGILPDGNYRLTIPAANLTDVALNPLASDLTFDFFVLAGDTNRDRTVNFTDLLTVARNYTKGPLATWADGDFDANGVVNFADLLAVARGYGKTLPVPPPAAPIPATPVFAEPAVVAAARRSRLRRRPRSPSRKRRPRRCSRRRQVEVGVLDDAGGNAVAGGEAEGGRGAEAAVRV